MAQGGVVKDAVHLGAGLANDVERRLRGIGEAVAQCVRVAGGAKRLGKTKWAWALFGAEAHDV